MLTSLLVVLLLAPIGPVGAADEIEPADDSEPAEPVDEPPAPEGAAPEQAPAKAGEAPAQTHKLVSVLVIDTLDRGAGAERTAAVQAALKKALNGLDNVEVLGPRGLLRIQGAMPTEVQVQLARADGFVRKGREELFNLAVEEAVETFQSARVIYRRHLAWLQDPERLIAALMGLAEALAAAGETDSAGMAYREVLVLSPDYEPDPGQVPTKLRSLFEQTRQDVSQEQAGQLSVAVSPRAATVVLDGLTAGKTPLIKGDLPPGLHMVRIQKDGFASLRKVIVVVSGETARVEGELEPHRIPTLIRQLRASLGKPAGRAESLRIAKDLATESGLPFVVASQVIDLADGLEPVLSVAVLPAEGKPSTVAARLPTAASGQLEQVVGALAWQIADALEEGSAPVPVPPSLGLVFDDSLLGRPRPKAVTVVRLAPGTDTRPDDAAYPGTGDPIGTPPPGAVASEAPGAASPWWTEWWFWTGVGAVVAGGVATSLALTLEPKTKTITEADQIRIRVIRNPSP